MAPLGGAAALAARGLYLPDSPSSPKAACPGGSSVHDRRVHPRDPHDHPAFLRAAARLGRFRRRLQRPRARRGVRGRPMGRPGDRTVRPDADGAGAARGSLRPGHLRRLQGVPTRRPRSRALPARRQPRAHEPHLRADGHAGDSGVDLHRGHRRPGARRSAVDPRETRQRAVRNHIIYLVSMVRYR